MIYIGAALTSLMCGTLIASSIWPIPQLQAEIPAAAPVQAATKAAQTTQRPRIDVVFVVDTTGSMGGLLEGAKQTIWSIANRLSSGEPRPDIRVGLVAYRDITDEYVTKRFPLTRDLDTIHGQLSQLVAAGGGDSPEHVNRGLSDAIDGMSWEEGQGVLRLVFLVGDAPPHDDYNDGPTSAELARRAAAKNITINTVRCGQMSETAAAWRLIASLAGGQMTTIEQDGGVRAISSPFDDELAYLNRSLATSSLGWGSATDKANARRKVRVRANMSGQAAASAASYSAKNAYFVDEDLVTAIEDGRIELDRVDNALLPEAMQSMSSTEQRAYVDGLRSKRSKLNQQILEVSARRDAYIEDNAPAEGFDNKVVDILREQAAEIGVAY